MYNDSMNLFEDIQSFVRVVEAGSITQAAEQLGTVKSAISQRLSRLESRMGVQLIIRTTRSQKLTEAGHSYYRSCLNILDQVSLAEASVKQQNTALAGQIKIAVPLSFGLNHLNQAFRQFNAIHPDVMFQIDFNDRQVDLVNEGFDVGIRIARLRDSTLVAKKITHTQLVLCASPAYLDQHGVPKHPNDLKQGHIKLKYNQSPDVWKFADTQGGQCQVKVPNQMVCNNGEFMRDAAIDGQGLVMIPDFLCYKAIKAGQLLPLLCDFKTNDVLNAYAIYPSNRYVPMRVKKLINYLSEYFGDQPYWQVLSS